MTVVSAFGSGRYTAGHTHSCDADAHWPHIYILEVVIHITRLSVFNPSALSPHEPCIMHHLQLVVEHLFSACQELLGQPIAYGTLLAFNVCEDVGIK